MLGQVDAHFWSVLSVPAQILLKDETGQKELERWPQYQGHLVSGPSNRKYLHMNTVKYFLLWTAFYVLRSGQSSSGQQTRSRRPVFSSVSYGSLGFKQVGSAHLLFVCVHMYPLIHPFYLLLAYGKYIAHGALSIRLLSTVSWLRQTHRC